MKSKRNKLKRKILVQAISMCFPLSLQAANFDITVTNDDGTGLVANTLSWAILQANSNLGDDTIALKSDVTITGVMKRLITSNVIISSDTTRRTINGNSQFRPLFIKSGTVTIKGLDIDDGVAQGGASDIGAPGAGMGGSLFIYDGSVSINDVSFNNSKAYAGLSSSSSSSYGGGGMFGNSGNYGGGGLFASGSGASGGYGGFGNYQTNSANFGEGGTTDNYVQAESGGFGGGGAFPSGHGGLGGGGGARLNGDAGNGGFGAGAIYAGAYGSYSGQPGYGAVYGESAGMGGAIFIRSGNIEIINSSFNNNTAYATGGALGLGGGIFVLHSTTNSNDNNQGMPTTLASVTGCNNSFSGNMATGGQGVANNNDDLFDLGNRASSLLFPCPINQNLYVSQATDDGTGLIENTLSWAIKESNLIFGDDVITLETDVVFTGVMKRLIDSNMTIQSDNERRSILGDGNYRPLFIKSGTVVIQDLDILGGLARGGSGNGAGAGMGGSLFIYDGDVTISDTSFRYSQALGVATSSGGGGGGMFGNSYSGGGGLFANSTGDTGAYGGYGNYNNTVTNFGKGGNRGAGIIAGGFGGGGASSVVSGGNGGFGGGGGQGFNLKSGDGGFGGGGATAVLDEAGIAGYGAYKHESAAMGGAIFIRTGNIDIRNTRISNSSAFVPDNSKGLGGGLFILHTTINSNGNNQGMPASLATVTACGMEFSNNIATSLDATPNSTHDIFDLGNILMSTTGGLITDSCPVDPSDIIFKNSFED